MKKVFLALALVALVTVSCKRTNEEMAKIDAPLDSTSVAVDSTAADTTTVDTTTVTNH